MTGSTVAQMQTHLVNIVLLCSQKTLGFIHFVIQQKPVNGLPIQLFKPLFEFFDVDAHLMGQFL